MRKRYFLLLPVLLFMLPASSLANGIGGDFCAGDGYLAYAMSRGGYGISYLHIVRFGGSSGISKPAYVKVDEDRQVSGIKCDAGEVSVFLYDHINVYDVRPDGAPVFLGRMPVNNKGRLPEGFASRYLTHYYAGSEFPVRLHSSVDSAHRYEVIHKPGKLSTLTALVQYAPDGTPLKQLKLYESLGYEYFYDFDVENPRKKPVKEAYTLKTLNYSGNITDYFDGYKSKEMAALLNGALVLEEFIKAFPGDKRLPEAYFYLGKYRESIAEFGNSNANTLALKKKYMEDREDMFIVAEIAATMLYVGTDWNIVMERYPASALADDAGYLYYTRYQGGECEDYDSCCRWAIDKSGPFMRRFPESGYFDKTLESLVSGCNIDKTLPEQWKWAIGSTGNETPPHAALEEVLGLFMDVKDRIPRESWVNLRTIFEILGSDANVKKIDGVLKGRVK